MGHSPQDLEELDTAEATEHTREKANLPGHCNFPGK